MNKQELKIILNQFQEATARLKEALDMASLKNEVIRDGTIQRFEFTYEICWKSLMRFLENEGILAKTPKDVFRNAFRLGWLIEGDKFWTQMIKDRYTTSHTYSKPLADKIYMRIPGYYEAYQKLIQTLEQKIES